MVSFLKLNVLQILEVVFGRKVYSKCQSITLGIVLLYYCCYYFTNPLGSVMSVAEKVSDYCDLGEK